MTIAIAAQSRTGSRATRRGASQRISRSFRSCCRAMRRPDPRGWGPCLRLLGPLLRRRIWRRHNRRRRISCCRWRSCARPCHWAHHGRRAWFDAVSVPLGLGAWTTPTMPARTAIAKTAAAIQPQAVLAVRVSGSSRRVSRRHGPSLEFQSDMECLLNRSSPDNRLPAEAVPRFSNQTPDWEPGSRPNADKGKPRRGAKGQHGSRSREGIPDWDRGFPSPSRGRTRRAISRFLGARCTWRR